MSAAAGDVQTLKNCELLLNDVMRLEAKASEMNVYMARIATHVDLHVRTTHTHTHTHTHTRAGLMWVLFGAAALCSHLRNKPTATDEKKKIFSNLFVISLVGTISGKSFKIVATRCHISKLKCTKFILTGTAPKTLLGKIRALPQTTQLDITGSASTGKE